MMRSETSTNDRQLSFDFSPVPAKPTTHARPEALVQAQGLIREASLKAFNKALEYYGLKRVVPPEIDFSLRGRSAGQASWRVDKGVDGRSATNFRLRFNLEAYLLDPLDMVQETIPHEVAHLIVALRYGVRKNPHGREWKGVMRLCFGIEPKRTHGLNLTPARKVARDYIYSCNCQDHEFTSIRHNKIVKQRKKYRCRTCKEVLVFRKTR